MGEREEELKRLRKEKAQFIKAQDIVNELLKVYCDVEYGAAVLAAIRFIQSDEMTDEVWGTLSIKKGHTYSVSETTRTMAMKELWKRACPAPAPDGSEFDGL
jgi:hypothetical protein